MMQQVPLPEKLLRLRAEEKPYILAIDGRCGSGKSTLGSRLSREWNAALVHMDDFYLPPQRRAEDWMDIPAGNMDLERIRDEILIPFRSGDPVNYTPFLCGKGRMGQTISLEATGGLIIEGSYSHHPMLRSFYDGMIFVTCSQDEQRRRLMAREGERYINFARIWIPKEEQYFSAFSIAETSDQIIHTGGGEE